MKVIPPTPQRIDRGVVSHPRATGKICRKTCLSFAAGQARHLASRKAQPQRSRRPTQRVTIHHSPLSSSVPNGRRSEPKHGSAAASHRSCCKDGACRSPCPPAKCRRWRKTAPQRLSPARRGRGPAVGRDSQARLAADTCRNFRHRAVDVAVEAKPCDRGFLQAHAPQRPRIEPRRTAGIRDRGTEAQSGPEKRAAAGNRSEARFEPGRGQARRANARHVLDRLIGRHCAVGGDRRQTDPCAALPRDRLRPRCRSGNADARR